MVDPDAMQFEEELEGKDLEQITIRMDSQESGRASIGPPEIHLKNDNEDPAFLNMSLYNLDDGGSDQELDTNDMNQGGMEGDGEYDTGDKITAIKVNLWRPVLESYEFFQFEATKRLDLLSKTTEFFQFVHKHLVDEAVIVESKFPQMADWKRRTSVLIDWKGKNNVTDISKALRNCHLALTRELNFLECSRIICTEEKIETPLIRFQDIQLGDKTFRVGNYSVASPKHFFVGNRTFQSDDWKGALSKHHPGRTLMESASIYETGEQPDNPHDPQFQEFKKLLQEAEEEKLHNLCLSEYAASLRLKLTEASKLPPKKIVWQHIEDQITLNGTPHPEIMRSLEDSFRDIVYLFNPNPQHLPLLDGTDTHIRVLASPIIWLDSFTKLLRDRAAALFALKNAIMEFLRGRRKKDRREYGKCRIEVETLQVDVDEESERIKEVIQNFRIPNTAFAEFYESN